jgi:S1/P1 Nuclease
MTSLRFPEISRPHFEGPIYMRTLIAAILIALTSTQALAWGQIGHRVTGAIAEPLLSRKAAKEIRAILGNESLAEASTWPDEMRSSPEEFWQVTANPWHYVTVPAGKTYTEVGAPPQGDAVTALAKFAATLKDPAATLEQKQLALRFTVHLVGDLHQPLHVGNGTDRGGNDVKVTAGGNETNLHAVWDGYLVDREQLSYSEKTAWLARRLTPALKREWAVADPLVWVSESGAMRDTIYPTTPQISWKYAFDQQEKVDTRLMQAGVRMAAYLNDLFK